MAARAEAFLAALADDFNTPEALAELFGLIARRALGPSCPAPTRRSREMLALLGLEALAAGDDPGAVSAEAERLLAEREAARAERDFARADEIRDRLAELGYEVRDEAGGARLVPRG